MPNKAQQYIKSYYNYLERINSDDKDIKEDIKSKVSETDLDYSEDEKPFSSEKRFFFQF